MSYIEAKLDGDTDALLERLRKLSAINRADVMHAIAEGIRTSTEERFRTETAPDGRKWTPSIRAQEEGGKTLTKTAALKKSIRAQSGIAGAAVGTNLIYAATHQYGDERTIRAKNGRYLRFKVNGQWVSVPSVRVSIPARPFLGISSEDEEDIKDILDEVFKE
jgi:phage virion morphogenesis protein